MSRLAATRLNFTQALSVELTYRFGLVGMFAAYAVSMTGLILFWQAAARGLDATGAYTPTMLTAYFVVAFLHLVVHDNRISYLLSTSIRLGKLAGALLRPYPFLMSIYAQASAIAVLRLVLLLPIVALACVVVEPLREVVASLTLARAVTWLVSLSLSLLAGWFARTIVGLLAFDLTQTWGPELVFIAFYTMAGGEAYPIDLLPPLAHEAVTWTPAYYMIGFPTLVLLGRISEGALHTGLARGTLVVALSGLVVWAMWRRGVRRFEAIGI